MPELLPAQRALLDGAMPQVPDTPTRAAVLINELAALMGKEEGLYLANLVERQRQALATGLDAERRGHTALRSELRHA